MKKISNYGILALGLFLAAFSFSLFLAPYNLVAGGVSGLALLIHKLFQIQESTFIMVANLFLLGISFLFLGKEKTKNTILGSILFPLFISITNKFVPLIHIEELELIVIAALGGFLSGIGYGIIFKSGFTSGGTDILNQIMEKYLHIPISKSMILVDGIITLCGGFLFGFSLMIYSLISLLLISTFSHKTIIGEGKSKTLYITSSKINEIKYYLHNELKIDSTDFAIVGGYTKETQKMLMTVIQTKEYYRIKETIKAIDKNAFITVTDAYHLVNENVSIRKEKSFIAF